MKISKKQQECLNKLEGTKLYNVFYNLLLEKDNVIKELNSIEYGCSVLENEVYDRIGDIENKIDNMIEKVNNLSK